MLSEKMTLSLTFLVMVLAIGLVMTPAFAHKAGTPETDKAFEVSFTPGELMDDVSTTDHADITDIQVESGRNRTSVYPTAIPAADAGGPTLSFSIDFDRIVQLADVTEDNVSPDLNPLTLGDFTVDAYDDLFRSLGTIGLEKHVNADNEIVDAATDGTTTPIAILKFKTPRVTQIQDPGELPGRQFTLTIDNRALQNAYNVATGGAQVGPDDAITAQGFEIHHLLITLVHGAAQDASIGAVTTLRQDPLNADKALHHSAGPKFIRVDLVDADEGLPIYSKIVSGALVPAGAGDPGVVAISKVVERSLVSAVETGPFDIRIMLTEEPKEFTVDQIRVKNGSASNIRHLLPIPSPGTSGTGTANDTDADTDFATIAQEVGLNYYSPGTNPATVANPAFSQIPDTYAAPAALPVGLPGSSFPRATGRDNAYHLYAVTITPNADVNGFVTVSLNNLEDKVLPTSKEFDALTDAELVADTPQLSDPVEAERSRRAMNGREVLEVRVQTAAAVDIFKASTDHQAANPRLKFLPEKAVVPAGGYLVLARGKTDSDPISGVVSVSAKPADKKTAASKLYNVTYDFGLPFPADDLSNFFRNGGTLQLLHHDIAASTAGADADKGYAGATTGVVAAGSLKINEIMWGLDGGSTNGQYIEIMNTTDAEIGIDKNEWVIAVGAGADTLYTTVVDTVGNSAGWSVPGSDGNTKAGQATPTVIDIVSMSRVGADGTAEASWIASERPSANISGRRIGTPGAANNPSEAPAVEAEPEPEPTPTAPVAAADDIMISEVMVASNEGRLPQWVELANVSGAAVSLTGWSLSLENDAADADVVAESVGIDLSSLVIGEDQVALVVSKTGRNSGVGDAAGDIRADRILNVQDTVSPDNARYSLISEMGFMLTLMPPATPGSAIRNAGDEGGNLGMGWDVPASEDGRSSLIRREMGDAGEIMGTDAAGWVLASDTNLDGAYRSTYYGSDEDMGTPGYNAGGALPVELSIFGAKRDRLTGQVVITWDTQSELNNAGFFIKRSEEKNGKFVVVNPTMIAGAGTTAEKQSYTYTDTSAKPNVVYYYQIEDVSLDGNRQTLTRAHRLKGHLSPVGNKTTKWGELKSQE